MLYTDQKRNPESNGCDHDHCVIEPFDDCVYCVDCGENLGKVIDNVTVQEVVEEDDSHICAWCHFTVDKQGNRKRYLTDIEYITLSANESQSHGICNDCKANMLNSRTKESYEHNSVTL